MRVYADLRWSWKNGAAGIGVVKDELLRRKPLEIQVEELRVQGGLGNPFGPVSLALALPSNAESSNVFWSPGFMPPAWSRMPVVVTVHDLIHLKHYSKLHRFYYDSVLLKLYRRCAAVICVSRTIQDEFLEWSGIPEGRVHTIYNGVSERFFKIAGSSPFNGPYVLYAGNRRDYKNLRRLISAFADSKLPDSGIRLIVTGETDPDLLKMAARPGRAVFLTFAGHVLDEDLPALYRGALIVTLVSLCEGFGLPILEAMASGVPVLTSNISVMPEISGGAALLVDPYSADAIRAGLELLAFNAGERERLVRLGRNRALEFSWDTSARSFWSLITSIGTPRSA